MDQWIEAASIASVIVTGLFVWISSAKIYFDFNRSNFDSNSRKSKT